MGGIGEQTGGKSPEELRREAYSFVGHTLLSLLIYIAMVSAIYLAKPVSFSMALATILALVVPGIAGFVIAMIWPNEIAGYVWIFGLIYFSIICVYVLDLPTGPGLCEHCGALGKLWRTLVTFDHPSGLMETNGNVLGTWPALACIGYALGARFGLKSSN